MAEEAPLCAFGVIADIQYADADDGLSFDGTRRRFYRQSLAKLRAAVAAWTEEQPPLAFVLQLGDSIDGRCAGGGEADRSLGRVLAALEPLPVHHAWGNHELYNFNRARLARTGLRSRPTTAGPPATDCWVSQEYSAHGDRPAHGHCPAYRDSQQCQAYSFSPAAGLRIVLLDAYELSVLGWEPGSTRYQESMRLLREKNPNDNLNSPAGLKEPQFVEFNGGFSQAQLDWLNQVLKYSDENQEKVIVAGHVPLYPGASDSVCLAWNYQDALSVIHAHQCVVCVLAGHLHDGSYSLDTHGVHHLTLEGVIETPPESNAFGTIYVYKDKMILKGRGRISDRVMYF